MNSAYQMWLAWRESRRGQWLVQLQERAEAARQEWLGRRIRLCVPRQKIDTCGWVVEVSDTGIGIALEETAQLFSPFQQLVGHLSSAMAMPVRLQYRTERIRRGRACRVVAPEPPCQWRRA